MSKYITHFQTEAAYQSALPTLDLPNVSLVDELGEVHYHRALYGAHAGDIALYDVAEAQKIVVTAEDWNLTTYPTASYPIIGVVAEDESPLGCVVMSCLYVDSDGSQTTTVKDYKWQNTALPWSSAPNIQTDADAQAYSGKGKTETYAIIENIKAYDLAHGTDNVTGNIPDVIPKYSTIGTLNGDWFVPSTSVLYNVALKNTAINSTLAKINAADSSLSFSSLFTQGSLYINSFVRKGGDLWYLDTSNQNYQLGSSMGKTTSMRKLVPFTII